MKSRKCDGRKEMCGYGDMDDIVLYSIAPLMQKPTSLCTVRRHPRFSLSRAEAIYHLTSADHRLDGYSVRGIVKFVVLSRGFVSLGRLTLPWCLE